MKYWKSLLAVLFVCVVGLFAVRPLLQPGFFPMHDDTQVARVFEMGKALHDGMFPVRWAADLGYGFGYPIFNFYAPFAYYIGGMFTLFSIDALLATKLMMIVGILLASASMYFFCSEVWGKAGGIVGGIFYTFATYHALDIYVRGDVAEFFAYAFVPLAAYGVLMSFKKKHVLSVGIGAVGFAGVIISHNLTAMMIAPFLCIFALILSIILVKNNKKDARFLLPLAAFLGGILLAAFYWVPVFGEMKYTNVLSQVGGGADFKDHFVCLSQLWYSPWGYGGSVPGCTDGLSFMVGKLHLLAVVVSIPLLFTFWKKKKDVSVWLLGGLIGFVISVFLTTVFSKPIWETFHAMAFFQYPWRFLLLTAFFTSFLGAGCSVVFRTRLLRVFFVIVLSLGIVGLQYKFFIPQRVLHVTSNFYTNKHMLTWKTSKISDEYMPKGFTKPKTEDNIPQSPFSALGAKNGVLFITQDQTQRKEAIFQTQSPATLLVTIAYFPAWKLYIDGVDTTFSIHSYGLSSPISSGKHSIAVVYRSTLIEQIGNAVTLTGALLLILAIIYERRLLYGKKRT